EPERVVELNLRNADFPYAPLSIPDFRDLERAGAEVFAGVAASTLTVIPRDVGDRIEPVPSEMVSGGYFQTLGIRPHLGRLLGPEDDVSPGAHPVVVLSHDYWQTSFGGDPSVIGRSIRINGREYEVVGIAPPEYEGMLRGLPPAVYVPLMMINQLQPANYDQLQSRDDHGTFVRARLRPGVTLAQVRTALAAFRADMVARYPDTWQESSQVDARLLSDIVVNPLLDRFIVLAAGLLSVVVGLVLLIACANLASFLLAQARERQREVAIRLAIGAGRGALLRQLLTESVVLSLAGGLAGLGLARVLLATLQGADLPLPLPVHVQATLNPVVLGYAFALSVLAGVLFGLAPALQTTRDDVIGTIRSENTGGGRKRVLSLRDALVVAQVAGSVVLLVSAGLLLRSLQARQTIDPGFGSEPTALLTFNVPEGRTPEQARLMVERIEEEALRLPGVRAVGVTSNLHLNSLSTQTVNVKVEGFEPPPGQDHFLADHARVDAGYFDAAGIPIVRGRNFDAAWDREDGARVAIINQTMAERFWPGQDPVGRTFTGDTTRYTIVGVARDAKYRTLGEPPRLFVYTAYSQRYSPSLTILARTAADADGAAVRLLALVRSLDPELMVLETKTMERHLAIMLLPARLGALVFTAFAALALALALLGVYGVVSYAVARRTREVAIRMSIGADPAGVVRLLMRRGLALVGVGGAIGVVAALLGARALQGILYGVEPIDPITFMAVPVLLVAVGAAAAFVPARRAARIDPARVLTVD
ncbi:MAG TPA: ADOP family duplicated permease, partial [Longimicrobiales bacterium]